MQIYDDAGEDGMQGEAFFHTWHQTFGEEWIPLATVVHEIMVSNEMGSAEKKGEIDLGENLPGTLQISLKERHRSFSICLGKALDRLIYTCFGVENFR